LRQPGKAASDDGQRNDFGKDKNMKKIYILYSLLFYTISHSAVEIPRITGFTTIEKEVTKNVVVQFLLDEGMINQFVAFFPNSIVVNEGGIVTNDGLILQDTETYKPDQHRIMRGNIPEKKVRFDSSLAVISSPGQENWYHWLLQVLPRLKILAESGCEFDRIYVNDLLYPWQKESLLIACTMLNIPHEKIAPYEGNILIQAKTLIVPSVPFIPSKERKVLPTWLKNFLYDSFLKEPAQTTTPERIYISRSKANSRRIAHEEKLMEILKPHDFTLIYLEDLSVYDQATLFHHAKIIIGPHGSGFANLIFAKPGTTIIEIDHGLEGEDQRSYFKRFAGLMNCYYFPFYADFIDEEGLEQDIYIDCDTFKNFIEKVLK